MVKSLNCQLAVHQQAMLSVVGFFSVIGLLFTLVPIPGIIILSSFTIACGIASLLVVKESLLVRGSMAIGYTLFFGLMEWLFLTNIKIGWGVNIFLVLVMVVTIVYGERLEKKGDSDGTNAGQEEREKGS